METKYTIPHYILVSKNTRALNFVLDLIFIYVLLLIVYFFSSFIEFNIDYPHFSDWIDSFDQAENFIFTSIVWFSYYGTTEFFLSRTFAKYDTKTVVVLNDGAKPHFFHILARTTLKIVPFEYFTFLKGREPCWHDELSNTFVVVKSKLENSKKEFIELGQFQTN